MKLIYKIATMSASERVHKMLYRHLEFKPVGMHNKFRFDCKMSGNCCRGRSLQSCIVPGKTQTDKINQYCEQFGIPVKGLSMGRRLPVLRLDGGLDGGVDLCDRVAARTTVAGSAGVVWTAPTNGLDCQFLAGNLCTVNPVKPLLCKLAPLGYVLQHEEAGGIIYFAIQPKPECKECMEGKEHKVSDWLDEMTTESEFNKIINDQRIYSGWWPLNT